MRSATLSVLALAGAVAGQASSGSGRTTRYWDCCKPSCAWPDKAAVSAPARTCDRNDNPLGPEARSGCDSNGVAFTCSNNQPWAINDNVAFGFAATAISGGTEASWCCACYALQFTSGPVAGKTLVVQSTNTGGDLGHNHFDIQMPGGGLGLFDGCTPQFGFQFPGNRYGGTTSRSQCSELPASLQEGCYWRYDWFRDADNPDVNWRRVQCPAQLTNISGCRRQDDGNYPVFDVPSPSPPPTNPPPTNPPPTNPPPTNPPPSTPPPSGSPVEVWGQCNSQDWPAPRPCVSGTSCVELNPWYSQCQP
ncbi:hypothetical protein SODALDRAFT_344699 [Sodiomyces alkalinus F11]|uniref:Cellulase n=1 Tax=Sodiomyces alkalinus (strain CBS 110278 / VKM F-3762 / F11) TaxID=1314773 RepID=A0A3N2PTG5_SODAK|nr:hypothetical protein SODALDRAFT_344699 [Sodiomyces alkalinus F11]ROT37802.1 hypothetical protein SODALDRAFT_344699 [Sodiomyces alkalinus F11]